VTQLVSITTLAETHFRVFQAGRDRLLPGPWISGRRKVFFDLEIPKVMPKESVGQAFAFGRPHVWTKILLIGELSL